MVIGARKLFTSALGLVLAGSLVGGPAANATVVDAAGGVRAASEPLYTGYDVALAPNAAPAGAPVQLHGHIGDEGLRAPKAGVTATIYFDPTGTAPRAVVATVVTNNSGWFAKTFQPRTSGTFDVLVAGGGEINGINRATFTVRSTSQAVRSAVVSATRNGYTANVRVIAQDIVTTVEPQTVYLDAGVLVHGSSGNIYDGPYMTNRRAEGRYGAGDFSGTNQKIWRTSYSGVRTYRMSALHPAGLYDVGYQGEIGVSTDRWDTDGDGVSRTAWVRMPTDPITTIRVRRASSTTITASSTSFTGPRTIELRGSVRKVQLVSPREAAVRLAPNTVVRLYFDQAGPRGPVYRKTVRTDSRGTYRTTFRTSSSGQWIAKYRGTDLQAPSQAAVAITVN